MIKNYFKTAWRSLWRNKGYSFINITGLAVGLASAILIVLWIANETSVDRFHKNIGRIYDVYNLATNQGRTSCWNVTPKVMGKVIQQDFPEVESVVRYNWTESVLFDAGEKKLKAKGNIVDSGFLQMFSFPLLQGNTATALSNTYSVVITATLAKKLFGNTDAMGKLVRLDNQDNFTVTGILKDLPANTSFDFEYLVPWSYMRLLGGEDDYWSNNSTRTFVMLKKEASLAGIAPKLKVLRKKYDAESPAMENFLYPFGKSYLYGSFKNGKEDGGRIEFVKIFSLIAIFILLIACINFMNLSTARSEKRAKEVGIRKVIGALKQSLVTQFLGESILLALIAGVLALLIVYISLPYFNDLVNRRLELDLSNYKYWLTGLGIVVTAGLLAGLYPALYLSAFKPVAVLKGVFKKTNALVTPRKVLVITQFTFAIVLIIATIIVNLQLQNAQQRQAGYSKDNLLYCAVEGDISKNYALIKNEIMNSGAAVAVNKTSSPVTEAWSNTGGLMWEGKEVNNRTNVIRFCADEAVSKTLAFKIIAGRDLDLARYTTDSMGIMLNEAAAKLMGFKNPINQVIKDGGREWHVVGVVKDFIMGSPFRPIEPLVIEGALSRDLNIVNIKLNNKNSTSQNIAILKSAFSKYNPNYPFEYKFVDDEYAKKFEGEKRSGQLAALFAFLTIIISCLGLFGLASFMAENRIKEIGVRKVLGASVLSIAQLLSKEFLRLVLISIVIASPIAYWAMYKWLQNYPYHISIQWWVFAMAGILAVAIALLTVSFQAIKAGLANPVKSLRTE
jgi:putative ABC transport system permease protein